MRARLSLIALVALLACASLASLSEAAHRHSVYRGKTAQKYRVYAVSSPGRITLLRFKAKMLCRDGSYLFGVASDFEATPMNRGGRFTDTQYGKTDAVSWKGRLAKGRLTGTLRVKDRLRSGVRCDSGPVRFVAR